MRGGFLWKREKPQRVPHYTADPFSEAIRWKCYDDILSRLLLLSKTGVVIFPINIYGGGSFSFTMTNERWYRLLRLRGF